MNEAARVSPPSAPVGGTGLVLPPAGDADAMRRLTLLRRAEASRLLRAHAVALGPRLATALAGLAKRAPDEAADVVLAPCPAVAARTGRLADAADGWAFELARRDALPEPVEVRGTRLFAPAFGAMVQWNSGVRVALASGRLALQGGEGPKRSVALTAEGLAALEDPRLERVEAFPPYAPGLRLGLVDANPLAMVEAHPDKAGNALSLGDRPLAAWLDALREATSLVERHLPLLVEEMRRLSLLSIPVGYEPEKHLSASYREYVGACYLTLHPDVRTMAEALVHEFQHNKLNLASYHDALLENALGTTVRSPVRPDPRPIWGVLLAVHAFVPVAELYRRMIAEGDATIRGRLADVVARNDEGLRTLREHARPTRIGAALLEELEIAHAAHLALDLHRPEGVAWEG